MSTRLDFVAVGRAPGEAALAARVARAARGLGATVRAWGVGPHAHHAFATHELPAWVLPDLASLVAALAEARPRVACHATSLTCFELPSQLPVDGRLDVFLDSTWLVHHRAPAPQHHAVQAFLVAMPEEVYAIGAGRPGVAPRPHDPRVVPVGWFGTAGTTDAPPFATLYFSRSSPPGAWSWVRHLGGAIEQVRVERPDLAWVLVGEPGIPLPAFVERRSGWLPEAEMERLHAEAALVICHHGQVTIGRAAAAGTPVVSFAPGDAWRPSQPLRMADVECAAFARAGVVESVHGAQPSEVIARRILLALGRGRRPPGAQAEDGAVVAARRLLSVAAGGEGQR